MRRARSYPLLIVPLALAACQAQEAAMGAGATPATMADVEQAQAQWIQLAEAGDAAGVAQLYDADAVMLVGDGEPMVGRQAIQAGLSFEGLTGMEINTQYTELGIELVSTWGTYAQTYQTPEGAEQTVSGTFLAVARRQADDTWQIVYHMSIPDAAMPGEGMSEGSM